MRCNGGLELHNMKVIYCWCRGCSYNLEDKCVRDSVSMTGSGTCADKNVPQAWNSHEVKKNESKGKARTGKTT